MFTEEQIVDEVAVVPQPDEAEERRQVMVGGVTPFAQIAIGSNFMQGISQAPTGAGCKQNAARKNGIDETASVTDERPTVANALLNAVANVGR